MVIRKTRVPVSVSAYFAGMLALCFAAGTARQICLGLGFAALHELGHLAALKQSGGRPSRICLTAAGMRIERPPGLALGFGQEIAIAAAGPAVSLLLAGLFAVPAFFFSRPLSPEPCLLNLGFGLFNLLPVRQLDGGRMLYYALCRRMEEPVADRVVLAAGLVCLFVVVLLAGLSALRQGLSMPLVVMAVYLAACV
ncbi:MAG: site-2 protease family protein [Oscillospiraceae bacterium]|jgi:stage IV sporulation protein FB|nr:site-2 protease family protein [Oscillospiraceae bacterium]